MPSAWTCGAWGYSDSVNNCGDYQRTCVRSIVTPASCGGADCGALSVVETDASRYRCCSGVCIDCVLGAEVLVSTTYSNSALSCGTRTRVYERPIVTPPQNGGAACPDRTRTVVDTVSCPTTSTTSTTQPPLCYSCEMYASGIGCDTETKGCGTWESVDRCREVRAAPSTGPCTWNPVCTPEYSASNCGVSTTTTTLPTSCHPDGHDLGQVSGCVIGGMENQCQTLGAGCCSGQTHLTNLTSNPSDTSCGLGMDGTSGIPMKSADCSCGVGPSLTTTTTLPVSHSFDAGGYIDTRACDRFQRNPSVLYACNTNPQRSIHLSAGHLDFRSPCTSGGFEDAKTVDYNLYEVSWTGGSCKTANVASCVVDVSTINGSLSRTVTIRRKSDSQVVLSTTINATWNQYHVDSETPDEPGCPDPE